MTDERHFLQALLKGRTIRPAAVKMEVARLRRDIAEGLDKIGAPYDGSHFLPPVSQASEKYRLAGNWQLWHLCDEARA